MGKILDGESSGLKYVSRRLVAKSHPFEAFQQTSFFDIMRASVYDQ